MTKFPFFLGPPSYINTVEGARAGEWKTRVYISAEVLSDFF